MKVYSHFVRVTQGLMVGSLMAEAPHGALLGQGPALWLSPLLSTSRCPGILRSCQMPRKPKPQKQYWCSLCTTTTQQFPTQEPSRMGQTLAPRWTFCQLSQWWEAEGGGRRILIYIYKLYQYFHGGVPWKIPFFEAVMVFPLQSLRSATRVLKMCSQKLLNPLVRCSTAILVKADCASGTDSPHNLFSVIDTDCFLCESSSLLWTNTQIPHLSFKLLQKLHPRVFSCNFC